MNFKKEYDQNKKNMILYQSESVDITLFCCQYLTENNYLENSYEENLQLLNKALTNYSILKLAAWEFNFDDSTIKDWDNLSDILIELDRFIPTSDQKKRFFAQYNHCIAYIDQNIRKQSNIQLLLNNQIIIIDGENKVIIDDKNPVDITITLLEILSTLPKTEKNPVRK